MSERNPEVEAWLQKAAEDRLCIQNELAARDQPWSVICFHAQQASEKYLKAFLVAHGIRPQRTHDLGRLLSECLRFDASLATLEADCDALTDYAVDVRYPDLAVRIEEELARKAVETSERICVKIDQLL